MLDLTEFTAPPAVPRTAEAGPGSNLMDIYEQPFQLASNMAPGEEAAISMLRSTHLQPTETASMFFSRKNIDRLQAVLARRVEQSMGVAIDRQSDEQMLIVMRYVYMQSSSNTGGAAEVDRLNELVLAEIVPQVGAGLAQYVSYLRDASRLPTPIPRGQATSIRGTKTTELFRGL